VTEKLITNRKTSKLYCTAGSTFPFPGFFKALVTEELLANRKTSKIYHTAGTTFPSPIS
jgi:hypothetical protein